MPKPRKAVPAIIAALVLITLSLTAQSPVRWDVVAKIREEGLQRSQVMDIAGYITDVLGARLTNSEAMKRAQDWAAERCQVSASRTSLPSLSWTTASPGTMSISLFT